MPAAWRFPLRLCAVGLWLGLLTAPARAEVKCGPGEYYGQAHHGVAMHALVLASLRDAWAGRWCNTVRRRTTLLLPVVELRLRVLAVPCTQP